MTRRAPSALVVVLVAVALVVTACTSGDDDPATPTTQPDTPTSKPFDFSKAKLAGVDGGATTTTLALHPGRASISGRVIGPEGPVKKASVEITRFVGYAEASQVVATGPLGRFKLENLLGGRYQVRAWKAPELVQEAATVFFLDGDAVQELTLEVTRLGGFMALPAVSPDPPLVGKPTRLRVKVVRRRVSVDGNVFGDPVLLTDVDLFSTARWTVESSTRTRTNLSGVAEWSIRCAREGQHSMSLYVEGTEPVSFTLPACIVPAGGGGPPSTAATTTTSTTVEQTTTTAAADG